MKYKQPVLWATIIVGLFFVTRSYVQFRYDQLKPKSSRYSEFYMNAPTKIEKVYSFTIDGKEFYEMVGTLGKHDLLYVPSDSPAYIFDQKGNLIEYSLDTGDDPRYLDKWRKNDRKIINIEEMDKLVRENHG